MENSQNNGATAPKRPESDSLRLLRQAEADLSQTEQNSAATAATLAEHRTALERIQSSLTITNETLDTARTFIRRMLHRDNRAKLFLVGLAIVLLIIVVVVAAYLAEQHVHK